MPDIIFLLKRTGCCRTAIPRLSEHREEHESFRRTVLKLQEGYNVGKDHIYLEVLQFLKTWIRRHLLESDADYSRFNKTVVLKNIV